MILVPSPQAIVPSELNYSTPYDQVRGALDQANKGPQKPVYLETWYDLAGPLELGAANLDGFDPQYCGLRQSADGDTLTISGSGNFRNIGICAAPGFTPTGGAAIRYLGGESSSCNEIVVTGLYDGSVINGGHAIHRRNMKVRDMLGRGYYAGGLKGEIFEIIDEDCGAKNCVGTATVTDGNVSSHIRRRFGSEKNLGGGVHLCNTIPGANDPGIIRIIDLSLDETQGGWGVFAEKGNDVTLSLGWIGGTAGIGLWAKVPMTVGDTGCGNNHGPALQVDGPLAQVTWTAGRCIGVDVINGAPEPTFTGTFVKR